MDYLKSCVLASTLCLLLIVGINGLAINSFIPTGNGILGPSSLKLTCSYTLAQNDNLFYITIHANINNTFVAIATFSPPGGSNPVFPDSGNYLKDRVNLTNPTSSSTQAIMTFNEIKCEDEKQYKCIIGYVNSGNVQTTELTTSIVVKGSPAMPDTIPFMSPQQGLEEGQNISFTCTGNVGKPAGRFRWTKYRGPVGTDYTGVTTTAIQMPGSCTFNGTSVFTTTLAAEDNKAVIRCTVVDQELATDTMYRETQPESLAVYFKVRNIQVTKYPNKPSYAEGSGKITLTCTADGNPLPTYKWYNQSDMDTVIANGSSLLIGDLVKNTGSYACVAFNNYNGKYFNQTFTQLIKIEYTTTPAPTTTTSTTTSDPNASKSPQLPSTGDDGISTGAIIGIVVGVVGGVLLIIIVILCMRKCRNSKEGSIDEPPEKPRNNISFVDKPDALGDKNGPFNNQIQYADLTFEDRPRSRKPLQLSIDSDLNQAPYAEVMMPRV